MRAITQGYEILDTTAAQLHDDVWGLALALNATMTMDNDDIAGTGCETLPGELVPLEEFTYNNSKMGCLITWNLRRLTFSGVSVSMQLKSCHTCMPVDQISIIILLAGNCVLQ